MLCHSLGTLEGEQDFIFFTEPSYPENLPSLFVGYNSLIYWICCVSSLFWSTEQFPEVVGNSHYENLWNNLDKRELRDFRSTKNFNLQKNEMKVYIWTAEKVTRHLHLISSFFENFKFCWSTKILSWVVLSSGSPQKLQLFFKMTTYIWGLYWGLKWIRV